MKPVERFTRLTKILPQPQIMYTLLNSVHVTAGLLMKQVCVVLPSHQSWYSPFLWFHVHVYSYRYILNISSTTDYCPMDSAYCSISVAYDYHYSHYTARIEDHETTVRCYRDTQLKSFARYVFKYSTIIMSALIIVLIFTDTGHVSLMDVFIDVPFFSLREAQLSLPSEYYTIHTFTLHPTYQQTSYRGKT